MKSKNLYDIFNVTPTATHEEIMCSFWKLVQKYHHDHGYKEYVIKDILRIKRILIEKREAYDRFLKWQRENKTRIIPTCYQMRIFRKV